MIETDHRFVVEAPIGDVWSYVSEIGNWASSMPGYESFEETDEGHSTWVLKVALGALTRTMRLNVTIDDEREPEFISFSLEGANDPVSGRGSFAATAHGSGADLRGGDARDRGQRPDGGHRWRRCRGRSCRA